MPRTAVDIDVKKLRERMQLSQQRFADRFGFSVTTLRQWEQARRHPDMAARVLLAVIAHSPQVVDEAIAATRIVRAAAVVR